VHDFDGLYRHLGATTTWDSEGVVIRRRGYQVQVGWADVLGVRQIGGRPGYVQLLVRDHVPHSQLADDAWSIAVSSEPDANRLLTDLGWRARGAATTALELP
jgi:hypothetical protein